MPEHPLHQPLLECLHAARTSSTPVRLGLALSGGMDSMALLHALSQLRAHWPGPILAVHVHHGLSPHAQAWAEFCQQQALARGFDCVVHRVQVHALSLGLEAAARQARYQAFAASPVDWLLLAHHADDQAETILLQTLRGGGVAGWAGMPSQRQHGTQTLIRPWLQLHRQQLADYAQAEHLRWVEDESNADTRWRRNFFRHRILPELQQHYPQAVPQLLQCGLWAAEQRELARDLAEIDAGPEGLHAPRLALARLRQLSPARAGNLIRAWLHQAQARRPSPAALAELLNHVRAPKPQDRPLHDSQFEQNLGPNLALRTYRDHLYLVRATATPPSTSEHLDWPSHNESLWFWPVPAWSGRLWLCRATHGLSLAEVQAGLQLRPRREGERVRQGAQHTEAKKLWQAWGIPPWQRRHWPVVELADGSTVLPRPHSASAHAPTDHGNYFLFTWETLESQASPRPEPPEHETLS